MNIKKTIMTAAAIASMLFANAAQTTPEEVVNGKIQAVKNACAELNRTGNRGVIRYAFQSAMSSAEVLASPNALAEIDTIMSTNAVAVSIMNDSMVFATKFPNTTARAIAEWSGKYPTFMAALQAKKIPESSDKKAIKFRFELKNYANIVNGNGTIETKELNEIVNDITSAATYIARRHLRSQGKSFVSKKIVEKDANGKDVVKYENPSQPYMDELTEIVNAPKFAGLTAWFEKMGVDEADMPDVALIDEIYAISPEEFAEVRETVLDGTIGFNSTLQSKFRYILGTEGYNAFVKLYNEDAE